VEGLRVGPWELFRAGTRNGPAGKQVLGHVRQAGAEAPGVGEVCCLGLRGGLPGRREEHKSHCSFQPAGGKTLEGGVLEAAPAYPM
jgi:hypothetical protein